MRTDPSTSAQGAEGPEWGIHARKCRSCGALHYPVPRYCRRCHGDDFSDFDAGTRGTLYSFSEVHVAPKKFKVPYIVAYVDLPSGLRVFGRLVGDLADYALGDAVDLDKSSTPVASDGLAVPQLFFAKIVTEGGQ